MTSPDRAHIEVQPDLARFAAGVLGKIPTVLVNPGLLQVGDVIHVADLRLRVDGPPERVDPDAGLPRWAIPCAPDEDLLVGVDQQVLVERRLQPPQHLTAGQWNDKIHDYREPRYH